MSSNEITFKVISEKQCPFYQKGDTFKLSGNALLLRFEKENTFISTTIVRSPDEKESCRTLIGDLTNILTQYENIDKIPLIEMDCTGCSGFVRLQSNKDKTVAPSTLEDSSSHNYEIAAGLLSNFSIFQSLNEYNLREIFPLLKLHRYPKGAVIIKRGDPATNLYIILSGAVDVLDKNGVRLSTLIRGDVFGEMSLISGDVVGATIKVVEAATIIYVKEREFKEVLIKFPTVQMHLTRILAKRLAESNVMRANEITSGMAGQLSQISISEILQALNMSQKTGILTLALSEGSAELFLRDGNLIKAQYNELEGKGAIYKIFKENEGRFQFNPQLPAEHKDTPIIGSMMEMLLENSKMMDEENTYRERPEAQGESTVVYFS